MQRAERLFPRYGTTSRAPRNGGRAFRRCRATRRVLRGCSWRCLVARSRYRAHRRRMHGRLALGRACPGGSPSGCRYGSGMSGARRRDRAVPDPARCRVAAVRAAATTALGQVSSALLHCRVGGSAAGATFACPGCASPMPSFPSPACPPRRARGCRERLPCLRYTVRCKSCNGAATRRKRPSRATARGLHRAPARRAHTHRTARTRAAARTARFGRAERLAAERPHVGLAFEHPAPGR